MEKSAKNRKIEGYMNPSIKSAVKARKKAKHAAY